MRVKASTLRRAGLCLLLGVVTSWLVAWGLVIAAWRGAWELPMDGRTSGAALVGPYKVWATDDRAPGCTYEHWWVWRIDEPRDERLSAFGRAMGGNNGIDLFRAASQGASGYQIEWDTRRAEAFPRSLAARFIGDAVECEIIVVEIGWPFPLVQRVTTWEFANPRWAGPRDTASLETPWLKGSDPVRNRGGGPVDPIRLPYRPNWPGLAFNTAFYGGVWMLPFFGLPALRRTLRARHGRCGACGYDLAGTSDGPCPECGVVRSGRAG